MNILHSIYHIIKENNERKTNQLKRKKKGEKNWKKNQASKCQIIRAVSFLSSGFISIRDSMMNDSFCPKISPWIFAAFVPETRPDLAFKTYSTKWIGLRGITAEQFVMELYTLE